MIIAIKSMASNSNTLWGELHSAKSQMLSTQVSTMKEMPGHTCHLRCEGKQVLLYGSLYKDAASGGLHTHRIVNGPMWLYPDTNSGNHGADSRQLGEQQA